MSTKAYPLPGTLNSEHRGLDQRAVVVTDALLPSLVTVFANLFVTRHRLQFVIAVTLDLRVLTRRNHLLNTLLFQLIANLPRIIHAVAV